jgi:multicomponent Na+:H+ antiporter subunit D
VSSIQSHLPALQIIVPLVAGPIIVLLRHRIFAWAAATAVALFSLCASISLLDQVRTDGAIDYALGGWPQHVGIAYRIDVVNAFMLVLLSTITFVVMLFARQSVEREIEHSKHHLFYAAILLCFTGLMGICITGDAFNIFVFLEISSLSAYALIGMGSSPKAALASFRYLVMGTIGGTFILLGLGFLLMATGTLNMAELTKLIPAVADTTMIRAGFAFIVIGSAIKLALFPLHMWLPDCYTYAPSVVSSFLAATATKVSYYVLIRAVYGLFGAALIEQTYRMELVFLPLALMAIFVGSIKAIGQLNIKRLLAYSSVAQIGYMVLGLSFGNQEGLTGGIIHLFNHALMKGGLFLVLGCVAYQIGSTTIDDMRGLGKRMPLTAFAFVLGGLSMIGVPLTAGFISKWYLALGALKAGMWWVLPLILIASLLAVIYIWKVVEAAYFQEPPEGAECKDAPLGLLIPTYLLIGASFYFGIFTDPMLSAASEAAELLLTAGGVK